jgi:hypothetical protein
MSTDSTVPLNSPFFQGQPFNALSAPWAGFFNGLGGAVGIGSDTAVAVDGTTVAGASQYTANLKGDHLSVRMFGAAGDGVTDDTAAFQTALNTCAGLGAALLIPGDCTLLCTRVTLPSNTTVFGRPGATVRQKSGGASADTPLVTNATHSGAGNSNLYIEGIAFDGNSAAQAVTGVDILLLHNVSGVQIRNCSFGNAVRACIFGSLLTGIQICDCSFSNWAAGNVGAIYLAANSNDFAGGPVGSIQQVLISRCIVDGRVSHSSCIKLAADSTYTLRDVIVSENFVYPGNPATGVNLGVELWSASLSDSAFAYFSVRGNLVEAEAVDNTAIFGISISSGGSGGSFGRVEGNVVHHCRGVGIECIGSQLIVSGNTIDDCGSSISINASSYSIQSLSCVGNTISNPFIAASAGQSGVIQLLVQNQDGHGPYTMSDVDVSHNLITGLASPNGQQNLGIWLQANATGCNMYRVRVAHNTVVGPGTGSCIGIGIAQPAGTTIDYTTFEANMLESLNLGIGNAGTNSRYLLNRFRNVATQYYTALQSDAASIDLDTGNSVSVNQLQARSQSSPTVDTLGNVWFPGTNVFLSTGAKGVTPSNPNQIALNNINFGAPDQGGILSVNSAFTGFPNWAMTSDGSVSTKALFLILAAQTFGAQFGNATNSNGAGPGAWAFFANYNDAVYTGAGYPLEIEQSGARIFAGSGSPNGVVAANKGSIYLDITGNLFQKQTGSGNTGWVNCAYSLPNAGTPGTYNQVTTDAQGRVTAGANVAPGPTAQTTPAIAVNTPYQNLTSKPVWVNVSGYVNAGIDAIAYCDSGALSTIVSQFQCSTGPFYCTLSFVVPVNYYWKIATGFTLYSGTAVELA